MFAVFCVYSCILQYAACLFVILCVQILAICAVDDAIEFGGVLSHKYIQQLLPLFLNNMKAEDNVLRQCSIYGIAQSLRFAPEICLPLIPTLVPALMAFVALPNSRDEDNEGATENAVYALGTIYHNRKYREASSWGGYDAPSIAALWLQNLPLRADEVEAKVAHNQLCDYIESGDKAILGDNYSNLGQLLRIIADVFIDMPSSSLAHSSTIVRMRTIIQQIIGPEAGLKPDFLAFSLKNLTSVQQQVLTAVL